MHRKLLLMAFEKVGEELEGESGVKPSLNKCAIRLSEIITEDFAYSPKSFTTLYKKCQKNEEVDFHIPQPEVVCALARYLGYENYEEFVLMNKERGENGIDDGSALLNSPTYGTAQEKTSETFIGLNVNSKFRKGIAFIGIFILAITVSVYLFVDRQKWMVWNGNHYEMKPFDPELEKNGVLNLYDEDNYHHLKRITPTCETEFFNGDGSVRIWYGKNSSKQYEFFTALGEHPETGKTLKPITEYMIKKYICP